MLRALSILQPWAWLIVNGYKDIENRTWRLDYRGSLVVHAGKKCGHEQLDDYMHVQHKFPHIKMPPIREMGFGGIVGQVLVTDCVTASESPWFNGPYGFVLSDAKRCRFVSVPGRLGLFPVNAQQVIRL
jgi:ASCH domain-containing protein